MKIKETHYNQLKRKVNALLDKHPSIDVSKALTSMKYRWEIYWKCGGAFTNAQEYQYLDDNNIDTALKAILRERKAK